jgi:hypothetical protein
VALSGTTAVVDSPQHDAFSGRAYVFVKKTAGWKQSAELKFGGPDSEFARAGHHTAPSSS